MDVKIFLNARVKKKLHFNWVIGKIISDVNGRTDVNRWTDINGRTDVNRWTNVNRWTDMRQM